MATNRELLFGLLALQNGFVTAEQLVTSFGLWVQNKNRTLSDILVEQNAITGAVRELLTALVKQHMLQHGADPAQSLAALTSLPPIKAELEKIADSELNTALDTLYLQPRSTASDNATVDFAGKETPRRFTVLRAHAQGGLGRVSVALDHELNRHVALKEILPMRADEADCQERFVQEAEITGQLEHPGIVPVYALGSYGDGRPYYAMRFVEGENLKNAIEKFHASLDRKATLSGDNAVAFRSLLGRFVDVCQAVQYAHSRHVLHRDLKPDNILLGPYGETLVVDWGLAKTESQVNNVEDKCSRPVRVRSGSSAGTLDGSIVGTPSYMSPEQASGRVNELGPATDVYSLGATLFTVLTSKPPCRGRNVTDLIDKVRRGELDRPSHYWPSVPKTLEAVCLKALSLQPQDRYSSARDLADDLERWLADEPTDAFVEPWTAKLRRWIKRHPALVSSTAVCIVLSLLGVSMTAVIAYEHARQLANRELVITRQNTELIQNAEQLTIARHDAEAKQLVAEKNASIAREQSELALSTLNAVITDVQRSLNVPGGVKARNRVLATVLPQLEKVSTEFITKSQIDRNTQLALSELGETILQLGGGEAKTVSDRPSQLTANANSATQTAERLFSRALDIGKDIAMDQPNEPSSQEMLWRSYIRLGNAQFQLGKTSQALELLESGAEILRAQLSLPSRGSELQHELSSVLNTMGSVLLALGRSADATAKYRECLEIGRKLVADNEESTSNNDLAIGLRGLAKCLVSVGRTDEALSANQEALAIARRMATLYPNDVVQQQGLATSLEATALVLSFVGKTDEWGILTDESVALRQLISDQDPDDSRKKYSLAFTQSQAGSALMKMGRITDALDRFRCAEQIMTKLVASDPSDSHTAAKLSSLYERMGDAEWYLVRMSEALAYYEKSLDISRIAANSDPDNQDKKRSMARGISRVGEALTKLGRTDEAFEKYKEGLKVCKNIAAADPSNSQNKRELVVAHWVLGDHYATCRLVEQALAEYEEGLRLTNERLQLEAENPEVKRDLSICFRQLSEVQLQLGNVNDAQKLLEQGFEIVTTLAANDPQNAQKHRDLSDFRSAQGEVHCRAGNYAEAKKCFQLAIEVLEGLISRKQKVEESQIKIEEVRGFIKLCELGMSLDGDFARMLDQQTENRPELLQQWAELMILSRRADELAKIGNALRELSPNNAKCLYIAACCFAQISLHARQITEPLPPVKPDQPGRNTAIQCLRAAIDAGFADFDQMRHDPRLVPLKGDLGFEALFPK